MRHDLKIERAIVWAAINADRLSDQIDQESAIKQQNNIEERRHAVDRCHREPLGQPCEYLSRAGTELQVKASAMKVLRGFIARASE